MTAYQFRTYSIVCDELYSSLAHCAKRVHYWLNCTYGQTTHSAMTVSMANDMSSNIWQNAQKITPTLTWSKVWCAQKQLEMSTHDDEFDWSRPCFEQNRNATESIPSIIMGT